MTYCTSELRIHFLLSFFFFPVWLFGQEAMDGAAKEGHLDVVIWLHKNTSAGATKVAMVRKATKLLQPCYCDFDER